MKKKAIMTVDLDEWYHCRWATGSPNAKWHNTDEFFKDYYGTSKPIGELEAPTRRILDLFDRYEVKATFFILGEVCSFYPNLVEEITNRGHEVACHGLRHVDADLMTKEQFKTELDTAKKMLEHITKKKVVGYRAPNLVIYPWMIDILEQRNFLYDSSVCPARKIFGKYGYTKAPLNPYKLSKESMEVPGEREIVEIPIPVFPYVKLPAAVGIMTRIMGLWWTEIALKKALSTGFAAYYFHPYELNPKPKDVDKSLFFRNCGDKFAIMLETLLREYTFITIEDAIKEIS